MTLHTCSYTCQRPECIKAQRDELRAKAEANTAEIRRYHRACEMALEALEWFNRYGTDEHGPSLRGAEAALREVLGEKG